MNRLRVGLAVTGSFCTLSRTLQVMEDDSLPFQITPIVSFHAGSIDTRFGEAEYFRQRLQALSHDGSIIDSIEAAEPIGPKAMFDVLAIAPCTGNTLARLSANLIDTPVTMAAKSHLRGEKPIVIALATNDGLSGSAEHLGRMLSRRHYFFVPFGQDAPLAKPRSLVADLSLLPQAILAAAEGRQLQPILCLPAKE